MDAATYDKCSQIHNTYLSAIISVFYNTKWRVKLLKFSYLFTTYVVIFDLRKIKFKIELNNSMQYVFKIMIYTMWELNRRLFYTIGRSYFNYFNKVSSARGGGIYDAFLLNIKISVHQNKEVEFFDEAVKNRPMCKNRPGKCRKMALE